MRHICSIAASWTAAVILASSVGNAAVLTQAFNIQVPSGTMVGTAANVASSTFSQFNSTTGLLTSVNTSFLGAGSWVDPAGGQMLVLSLVVHGTAVVLAGQEYFFTPGTINFSFSGSDSYLPELTSFIGSGLAQVDLRVSGNGGTFTTPLTTGTVSYVFTPAAAVPKPETAWLMGFGLAAVGLLRGGWRIGLRKGLINSPQASPLPFPPATA